MGTLNGSEALLQILTAVMGARSLKEFDGRLGHALAQHLQCGASGLYLYSHVAQAFTPISETLLDPASPVYAIGQLPAAGTMKEAAVRAGRAMLCDNLQSASWTEARVACQAGHPAASVIVAPLRVRAPEPDAGLQTIGVLAALRTQAAAVFTEQDRGLIEELALHLAPVLQTVLASEERDILMAINSRIILGTVTMETLIPSIKDVLRQAIRHDMTGLARYTTSPEGPWFEPVYMDGVTFDPESLRRFPFQQMAPAALITTGRPLMMTGYNQERFAEAPYFESLGIHSAMLCPLTVRGAPYGFLAVGSRRRNAFSDRDLALAEHIGQHVSQAMANILAYEEIRHLTEQLERENVYLREEIHASIDFKELVGDSPALQRTLKAIEQVAPTDSTVLITGETGTGKELVAQAIHRLSPRKDRALIKVNCAALPPSLIESELFGHERGAFTNAVTRKIGRFELADHGTIFLDEIGEIPLDMQAKLLRVLEAQEFERVGSSQTTRVDVRVLAATNMDLEPAVRAGRFRADLYYRIKVFPIRIPPLRDRREDIPMLARHFVKKYGHRHRQAVTKISTETLGRLTAYPWPGNVRELEHMIERAVILAQGPVLTIEELEPALSAPPMDPSKSPVTLADAERGHILDVLAQTNWILAGPRGAAVRLGMKRSTLQHRMKKLGIRKSSSSPRP